MDHASKREITITLSPELSEWVKDYRYMRVVKQGDFDLTYREVIEEALEAFRKMQPAFDPRPESVKINEEKKLKKKLAARKLNSGKKRS